MNHREANDLDRHITGNWGEDSVDAEPEDAPDPRIAAADEIAKALEELLRARRSSRVYDVVGKHPTEGHSLNAEGMAVFNCEAALAAYNALQPKVGA